MSHNKLFTLAEANALIPQLELTMERMQRISMRVREEIEALARERGEQILPELSMQQVLRWKPSLRPLFEELAQAVQDIEQHGCSFKGLELGLVDFPARLGDEVVELCWQYGEKEVAFYHRRDEGFAGRQPLKPRQRKPQYYQ
ncbi:MAG TPA: DUF2203 domain-containing protein [Candidatus Binatia bacterium]|jgi:hypothetical protein|nr:DUF2203 domain-containing protein [Candidatus Binatia bacterium]